MSVSMKPPMLMSDSDSAPKPKKRAFLTDVKFWLAGSMALLLAIFVVASMALWLTEGMAASHYWMIPIILFPLIWSVAFFYPILDNNIRRASLVMTVTLMVSAGLLVAASIMGILGSV